MENFGCGHNFCTDDFNKIMSSIENKQFPSCGVQGCKESELDIDTIRAWIFRERQDYAKQEKMHKNLNELWNKKLLGGDAKIFYCPMVNCNGIYPLEEGVRGKVLCLFCDMNICATCRIPWSKLHDQFPDCKTYQDAIQGNIDPTLTNANFRKCPNCKKWIREN